MSDKAKDIVNTMYANDTFSQWLGIECLEKGAGISKLQMRVREDMLNSLKVAHGGISYSLADSALAFASNAHGNKAMSIETSISHNQEIKLGDVLTTRVEELSRSNRIASYLVYVENQEQVIVALFKGTVYITQKEW